uniref:Putative methyltransferase n=1 Tax=viral metagenome TaxID=1070528 RepID=A0A6M3XHT7_9ZZZZ
MSDEPAAPAAIQERKILFVSYFTSKYAQGAERLRGCLERLGLDHEVVPVKKASWLDAVRYKPTFILEMMNKHPEAFAVVWIDADGYVVQKPVLFWSIKEELAVRYYYWRNKDAKELLSGTFYIKNDARTRAEMQKWIDCLATANPNLSTPEQSVLNEMLTKGTVKLSVHELPEPYCRILADRGRRGIPADSVVVHYQFSRECRHNGVPPDVSRMPTTILSPTGFSRPPRVIRPAKISTPALAAKRKAAEENRNRHVIRTRKKVEAVRKFTIPSSVKQTARRRQIWALRRAKSNKTLSAEKIKNIIKVVGSAEYTRAKQIQLTRVILGTNEPSWGGVMGHPATPEQIRQSKVEMALLPSALRFDRCLPPGLPVVVMGNSPTIDSVPAATLLKLPRIGCNRALRHKSVWPNLLFVADREPYCQERDSGRLLAGSKRGVHTICSDSIFDPEVLLRGPYEMLSRRAQPTPKFEVFIYKIGPKIKTWNYDMVAAGLARIPVNTTTFEAPLVSCLNIAGSMLQAAAIIGAQTIYTIGIEMKWYDKATSHFFGAGSDVGAYPQDAALDKILSALSQVKAALTAAGIKVVNLSPYPKSPFASVFPAKPNTDLDRVLKTIPAWSERECFAQPKTNVEVQTDEEILQALAALPDDQLKSLASEPKE